MKTGVQGAEVPLFAATPRNGEFAKIGGQGADHILKIAGMQQRRTGYDENRGPGGGSLIGRGNAAKR